MDRALYSIEETRARLGGISRNSLYAMLRAGELPSVVIGCASCRRRRLLRSSEFPRLRSARLRTLSDHGGRWLRQASSFLRPLESPLALVSPTLSKYFDRRNGLVEAIPVPSLFASRSVVGSFFE
jgi:hypothetical protein